MDTKDIEFLLIITWIILGIVVLIDGPSKLIFGAIWIAYLAEAVRNLLLEVWENEDDSDDRSIVSRIYWRCISKKHRG